MPDYEFDFSSCRKHRPSSHQILEALGVAASLPTIKPMNLIIPIPNSHNTMRFDPTSTHIKVADDHFPIIYNQPITLQLRYLYRDHSNNKVAENIYFSGVLTHRDHTLLLSALEGFSRDGMGMETGDFLPEQIGLGHLAKNEWDVDYSDDDTPWHEFIDLTPIGHPEGHTVNPLEPFIANCQEVFTSGGYDESKCNEDDLVCQFT